MTNNNMWDCAERSFSVDDSSVFNFFFFLFLVCKLYLHNNPLINKGVMDSSFFSGTPCIYMYNIFFLK
jgi:hypothetical protein